MKKSIIYGVITLLWIIVCLVLYLLGLIDWIGIIVSFAFAVPPIFVDLFTSKEDAKRKQQLEHAGNLYRFLKYIDDLTIDNIRANRARQRSGAVTVMGLIDLEKTIHATIADPTTKAYYQNSVSIVFGKRQCEELYLKIEKDRQGFENLLAQKVLDLCPSENECDFYKLSLSDDLKKRLLLKRHKEIKENK